MDKSVYGSRSTTETWREYYENSLNTPGFHSLPKGSAPPQKDYWSYGFLARQSWNGFAGNAVSWDDFDEIGLAGGPRHELSGRYVVAEPDADLVARVQNRLIERCRNTQVDLGVTLGEYRETAEMFRSVASKTLGALREIKKGRLVPVVRKINGEEHTRFRKASDYRNRGQRGLGVLIGRETNKPKTLKDVADVSATTYLFAQFGLLPLYSELYKAVEVLERGYRGYPKPVTVRTTLSSPLNYNVGSSEPNGYQKTGAIQRSCTGVLEFWVDNPLFKTLDECGVMNPLSVAWEVVPLSFVIDWFLPVGKFLTNIVPPQGVSFASGYTYLKKSGTCSAYKTGWWRDPTDHWWSQQGHVKRRSILTSMPAYTTIVPNLGLSSGKVVSSIALLWQRRESLIKQIQAAT